MFLLVFLIGISGCVPHGKHLRDVREAYQKGLKVGRVIGRDDVLGQLRAPDCFVQNVDDLMNDHDTEAARKE